MCSMALHMESFCLFQYFPGNVFKCKQNDISLISFQKTKSEISGDNYYLVTTTVAFLFPFRKQRVRYLVTTTVAFLFSFRKQRVRYLVTTTVAFLFPFRKQRVRYLVTTSTVAFLLLTFGRIKVLHMLVETEIEFRPWVSRCDVYLVRKVDLSVFLILQISNNLAFTAPTFVVSISCVISVVLLRKKNKTVRQRELQRSRTRATVTILLFALLYGVCNIPLAVDFILRTYSWATNNTNLYRDLYQFDNSYYYRNAVDVLLIVANSAANPLLYFWRMLALREYTLIGIRKILRLKREVGRPSID